MKLSDENNYVQEFFERTLYNLELYYEYHERSKEIFKYEITQLINSLLGLVVFVKEDGVVFNSITLAEIKVENEITWNYCHRDGGRFEDKNFKNFLRHIRNAISHKNLTIKSNNENEIDSIVFKDKDRNNVFEVTFTIMEIRNLIDRLSHCIGAH